MLTSNIELVFTREVSCTLLISARPDSHALVANCRVVYPVPVIPDILTWFRVKEAVCQVPTILVTKLLGLAIASSVVPESDPPLWNLLAIVHTPVTHPAVWLLTTNPPTSSTIDSLPCAGEVVIVVSARGAQADCSGWRWRNYRQCVLLLTSHVEFVITRKASRTILKPSRPDSKALVTICWIVQPVPLVTNGSRWKSTL